MFQSDRAIRIGARQNHADRALSVGLRERAEKKIDRDATTERLLRRNKRERAVSKRQLMIWRNHINVIRPHLHRFRHLRYRHLRFLLEHTRQLALIFRRKMHHHDKAQATLRIHAAEKLLQRRNTSR